MSWDPLLGTPPERPQPGRGVLDPPDPLPDLPPGLTPKRPARPEPVRVVLDRGAPAEPGGPRPPEPPDAGSLDGPSGVVSDEPPAERTVSLAALDLPDPRISLGSTGPELQPPSADRRRWSFQGSDQLLYEAQEAEREEGLVVLRGQVDVRVGNERIRADEVVLDEAANRLVAEGNVVLEHEGSRLTGRRLEYDLVTSAGTVWDALGYTGDTLNFTGARVEQVEPGKYVVYDGTFTSCTQPLPVFQVKASKAIIEVDKFVYVWNPRVYFKKVPAFYVPFGMFPIRQERTTGFMIPSISQSSLRGVSVEEEFFWAINRSMDVTIGGEYWQKYGWKTTLDGRWHLDGMTQPGRFQAIVIGANEEEIVDAEQLGEFRYDVKVEHRQKLFQDTWDMFLQGEYGTDQLVGKEFEPWALTSRSPIFNQRLTLQRRWGKHSLNIELENDQRDTESTLNPPTDFEDLEQTTRKTTRELPIVEYRSSGLQLGGQRWASLSLQGSVGAFGRGEKLTFDAFDADTPVVFRSHATRFSHDYWRADVAPQFRFPLGNQFLEIVPELNLRATWFSAREGDETTEDVLITPDVTRTVTGVETLDEGLFAWAWDAALRINGPDFARIYNRDALPGQPKWQHLIEPRIEFTHRPRIDDRPWISGDQASGFYDQRTRERSQSLRLGLVHTFRRKLMPFPGEKGESARDVVRWSLSTEYDVDRRESEMGERRPPEWGNVTSDVEFRPSDDLRFSLRKTIDSNQWDITTTSLVGGFQRDWGYLDLAYNLSRSSSDLTTSGQELSVTGEHWFYKDDRIRLGYDFTHDFSATGNESDWPYRRLIASYYNQCFGVSLSWEDNALISTQREREWELLISLRDVGNFLRYRERSGP